MARLLTKLSNPTMESAREFFNWTVDKFPVYNSNGQAIEGYNEFRSSKGHTLHVGNDTYSPAQPGIAFEKTVEAMNGMNLNYNVNGVGSFDNDVNIFAQFDVNSNGGGGASRYGYKGSKFSVGGKDYQGFITMAKGNDGGIPLSYWLTIVCIVCANTFRAALKARKAGNSVVMKQTKNSAERLEDIQNEIIALFEYQETVAATLNRMANQAITLSEAEKAFLGLIKPVGDKTELSKTGNTRLENSLEKYMGAFKSSPGVNGATREDWFNAVTYVDTHGDTSAKKFDPAKQFVSSEFGTYANRKSLAFEVAANDQSWESMVQTGEQVMGDLLKRSVTVIQPVPSNDLGRLLAMK
jgi:hypothetical protein